VSYPQLQIATVTEFGVAGPLAYPKVSIGTLPDDILLEIFNFYVDESQAIDEWHTLVHVCRRWRTVVFTSPRRLDLRLLCTEKTPVRKLLDIWPVLPIVVGVRDDPTSLMDGAENIIAALEHHDRVCEVIFQRVPRSVLEIFAAVIQEPLPALTFLMLQSNDQSALVLPDSFLGGSAPRLRSLWLDFISFPTMRELLLSASDLVHLDIWNIPDSGYISPDAMFSCLTVMTRLETCHIGFHSPRPRPDPTTRHPPPPTRIVFPVLTLLWFRGVSEYLEDLVAQFDAPQLDFIEITYFNQLVFGNSQLPRFISHAEKFKELSQADIVFYDHSVKVTLSPQTITDDHRWLTLEILCTESDWQLSSLTQVCSSSLPPGPLSFLERLYIHEDRYSRPLWQDDAENAQWLECLYPFTAVKNLYLSEELWPRVAPALQGLHGERAEKVLPALQELFIAGLGSFGPVQEAIGPFIASRQRFDRPIAVQLWEIELERASGSEYG